MNKDVVQKEFQGGSFRLILPVGLLSLGVTAFCIWQGWFVWDGHKNLDPQLFAETPVSAQPPILAGALDGSCYHASGNRSIRVSDFYLVARHNLREGITLEPQDLKVVRMPGLHGYELAFFGPEGVVGMSLAHALPEGQPVLPYHVEVSLKNRKYNKFGASAEH